jgi:MFS transporter, AAHS family, 4-hydroxybenzoate transporter
VINVSARIDDSRLSSFHLRVVGLCAALVLCDGYDVTAVSYAAPAIASSLGVSRPLLGPVFSAGIFGLTLGALLFGPLGDRWGRKRAFILAGALFGMATLGTATATSLTSLIGWRFVAGIGLGGATPVAVTIATDFCPRRVRSALTMIMYGGFTVGGILGGVVSTAVPTWGWQAMFAIGGVAPLLLAPLLVATLPETPQFLVLAGRWPEVASLLQKIDPGYRPADGDQYSLDHVVQAPAFTVRELFRHGYAPRTILLWTIFFVTLVALYFYATWLPTLLHGQGIDPTRTAIITGASQFGGLVGTLALAGVSIVVRPFTIMLGGYAAAAVAMVGLAMLGGDAGVLVAANFVTGAFLIGTQSVLNATAATLYPPEVRSTGVGWGIGIGRIGGILGPSLAGLLLALELAPQTLFMFAAIPLALAAGLAWIIGIVVKHPPSTRVATAATARWVSPP